MPDFQPFDAFKMPLGGLRMIEASAGTGKTFGLASLYLRLIVEKGLKVSQILTVTFTRAAAEELRSRIRRRIVQASQIALGSDCAQQDSEEGRFAKDVIERACAQGGQERGALARRLLREAQRMNEAMIATIHGFALRAALECAFENCIPFDRGEQADDRDIFREVIADYWRSKAVSADEPAVKAFLSLWKTPETLFGALAPALYRPYAKLLGPSYEEAARLAAKARSLWPSEGSALKEALLSLEAEGGFWSGRELEKAVQLAGGVEPLLEALESALHGGFEGIPVLPAWVFSLAPEKIGSQIKKGSKAKFHAHETDLVRKIIELARLSRLGMLRFILGRVKDGTHERKRERRLFSYDDMILDLHRAACSDDGSLARKLHKVWPWALVDEFQDTDPFQYEILKRVYADGDFGGLIMVGDPKQAIFAFRGADVYAYLKAAEDAKERFSMQKNFRSTPGVLKAIASLFDSSKNPFVLKGVEYRKIEPALKNAQASVLFKGKPLVPMTIWTLFPEGDQQSLTKPAATQKAMEATTQTILELLHPESRAFYTKDGASYEPLKASDIAVIVPMNKDASGIQAELSRHGIPAVCLHEKSVWETEHAAHVLSLLHAAQDPGNERLVRGALTTDLARSAVMARLKKGQLDLEGLDGACGIQFLAKLRDDEGEMQKALGVFQQAYDGWSRYGVLKMLEDFLKDAASSVLGRYDGERCMANYLQIAELLAEAELRTFGMVGLTRWLEKEIRKAAQNKGPAQLRVESDENAVHVSTVHKAKGLEYPVVFLPLAMFFGTQGKPENPPYFYHDEGGQAWIDYGTDPDNASKERAMNECRAESVRLLYVALTRAKVAVFLAHGAVNTAGDGALFRLLSLNSGELTPEAVRQSLGPLKENPNIAIEELPEPKGDGRLPPPCITPGEGVRTDFPEPRPFWGVFSFTGLSHGQTGMLEEAGGEDEPSRAPESGVPQEDALPAGKEAEPCALPKGPGFGRAFHAVLQMADVAAWPKPGESPAEELMARIERVFSKEGVGLGENDTEKRAKLMAIVDMVCRTLHTPLPEIKRPLSAIQREFRVAEMKFFFPLGGERLGQVLKFLQEKGHGRGLSSDAEGGRALRGMMTGAIDLVFEHEGRFSIVDFKTNVLAGYGKKDLEAAIRASHYDLQFLIYLVALHRYLGLRLRGYTPEKNLGNAYYLFVRGMGNGQDQGVYCHRTDPGVIGRLDSLFQRDTK